MAGPNPTGSCLCGCGRPTRLATQTISKWGHIKGQPVRFLPGHANQGARFPHRWSRLQDWYSPEPNTGCWLWTGQLSDRGYPMTTYANKKYRAHRLFYEQARGPIPAGMTLDHLCRVRCCVNPDHLEAVTQTENRRRGVRAHLPDEIARWVRVSPINVAQASRLSGIPRTTIARIRSGQSWRG
jgi:HNH endonuclease